MTTEWKRDVLAWMKRQKPEVTLTALAPQVGLTQSGLSRFLNGPQPTRKAAKAIARITGIPLQGTAGEDPGWSQLGADLKRERPEEYAQFRNLFESMVKPKPR